MAESTPREPPTSSIPRETYLSGYGLAFLQSQRSRSASVEAGFLLPHLRPGMRLLDCGCGPGSITVGLAEAVAPGEVVGIDINAGVIETARALALAGGITNIRFDVGNIYELPFPDSSFDAAFAHAVLVNLDEPVKALQEIRRVLKPGGVVAIVDVDPPGTRLMEPVTPLLERWNELQERSMARKYLARHHRGLLLEAGFVRSEGSARAFYFGTLEETRRHAELMVETTLGPRWAGLAIGAVELEAMAAEIRAWGERPDAFFVQTSCQAVGWVPDAK